MKNRQLLTLLLACSPLLASAHNITLGEPVLDVDVKKHGEIILNDGEAEYQAWSNQTMLGKVRVIQAIAGRGSSKELNAPLMAAITAAKFPEDAYQTTTIINQDDAMWGTGSIVKSKAQNSKKEFPWSSMVLDADGAVASAWELEEESSAIIVQDKLGKVVFVKEGALDESEVASVITLIREHL
ncbi:YtfJ family protein [Vibrio sp. ZSDE26]|uniref:YtfJ family protein n=1 Tax=Vibrio amylolyticus TaxID=2847292 RepID=A0A9X1XPD0_9VIBR|nr:YtfJ family protein [Vibrio amylolyticus]MCK6263094.1 YtfJ family protein [Vibrio amylolyticus]